MAASYYISAREQFPVPAGTESFESLRRNLLKQQIRAAFEAQVDYVQVREKDLDAGELTTLVENLVRLAEKKACRLLVNERADVARAANADGVHLPADAAPVAALRSWVGKEWIVGASCHTVQQVEDAAAGGADYVLLGPVYETPSKRGAKPLGLAAFGEICRRFTIPVFALGGVDLANARACTEAGASGIAGIRLFQNAADLAAVCSQIRAL